MTNTYKITKATLDLVPGDVVLHGEGRDEVVQVVPPHGPGCVVVRVDVLRNGSSAHFYAGLSSKQVVEVWA